MVRLGWALTSSWVVRQKAHGIAGIDLRWRPWLVVCVDFQPRSIGVEKHGAFGADEGESGWRRRPGDSPTDAPAGDCGGCATSRVSERKPKSSILRFWCSAKK